jgi:hypothetical protein
VLCPMPGRSHDTVNGDGRVISEVELLRPIRSAGNGMQITVGQGIVSVSPKIFNRRSSLKSTLCSGPSSIWLPLCTACCEVGVTHCSSRDSRGRPLVVNMMPHSSGPRCRTMVHGTDSDRRFVQFESMSNTRRSVVAV